MHACHTKIILRGVRTLYLPSLLSCFLILIMQTSSYKIDRKGSLVSQNSTSPEASVVLPPSPISVEELSLQPSSKPSSKPFSNVPAALQLLRDRRACILKENWNPIKLQPGDYDELWRQVERDEELLGYVEDKVRYEKNLVREIQYLITQP